MILNFKKYIVATLLVGGMTAITSCSDFLDRSPLDEVTPEVYFSTEDDLASYAIGGYNFTVHDGWNAGNALINEYHTDNVMYYSASNTYWEQGYRRTTSEDSSYEFATIRRANYFFDQVLPKYDAGSISGDVSNIEHYIGEIYFQRAWEYFSNLKTYGDFPIITDVLVDNEASLIEQSKRSPRNEVARFILEDLDKAANLLQDNMNSRNRITRNVALLVKSRVALSEASWLTYFKNTPFVPGTNEWPGYQKDYNNGFTLDVDSEIDFFLTEAMAAAKEVADKITLTPNSGKMNPEHFEYWGWNDYFEMFASEDPSQYSEVLFWKAYSSSLGVVHGIPTYVSSGCGYGLTRNLVESFLMSNGLPIYAAASGYHGDLTMDAALEDRDERLQLFTFSESDVVTSYSDEIEYFGKLNFSGATTQRDMGGYRSLKCYTYSPDHRIGATLSATTGCVLFRGAEAYLNYMEAQYMKDGAINSTTRTYWQELRARAGVSTDIDATIAATDLTKEKDWAVYSGGVRVDATLYNIRRERRSELMLEGDRWNDLKRWRALDQVKNDIPEGVNMWGGNMADLYDEGTLIQAGNDNANISSAADSDYIRPYRVIEANNAIYNGYNWTFAAYLSPLPIQEFVLTSDKGDTSYSSSPLYQNPYWPTEANATATKFD